MKMRKHDLDRRANSLKLKPRKPQTNSFAKSFVIPPPLTDIDYIGFHRIAACINARNNGGRYRND